MLTEHTILQDAANTLNDEIKKAFQEQGHHLTGMWEESLSTTSYTTNEIEGWAKSYGAIVDSGVTAGRIPFGGGDGHIGGVGISEIKWSGEGESFHPVSKYIQGLFNFWKLRKPGITDKEALSLAFATAKVQKKEGMSTYGSRAYSESGERQQFVEQAFTQSDKMISDIVFNGLSEMVNENAIEEKQLVY